MLTLLNLDDVRSNNPWVTNNHEILFHLKYATMLTYWSLRPSIRGSSSKHDFYSSRDRNTLLNQNTRRDSRVKILTRKIRSNTDLNVLGKACFENSIAFTNKTKEIIEENIREDVENKK